MRIGILSDTHDRLDRTRRAVAKLRSAGAEVLIHCGDFTVPEVVSICSVLPFYFVFGNNDLENTFDLRQAAKETGSRCLEWGDVIELAGKRIGIVHGHQSREVRRLLELSPGYLLSGHTHVPIDVMNDDIRYINPGALHRAREFSVAFLDLVTDQLQFLEVPS